MGGIGSGRVSARASVEASLAVRLASLYPAIRKAQATALTQGGKLTWSTPDLVQSARYVVSPGVAGVLVLTLYPDSGDWFSVEPILFVSARQPRGGLRWWMCCPTCRRRTRALFLHEQRWCCRRCADLTYQSSRDSDKRLGPLLRSIEQAWLTKTPGGPDLDIPAPPSKGDVLQDVLARPGATRDLRLQLKARRLALSRLLHGRPLYRLERSRTPQRRENPAPGPSV